ncbi:hypothetical protein D3C84_1174440 [compost metagenome]
MASRMPVTLGEVEAIRSGLDCPAATAVAGRSPTAVQASRISAATASVGANVSFFIGDLSSATSEAGRVRQRVLARLNVDAMQSHSILQN